VRITGIVAALALLSGPRGIEVPGHPGASPDRIDSYVRAFIARHDIPSAAIAVVDHGKVVKTAGYGSASLELHVAASTRSVYEIGSITKQFTAEAVMMLAAEGKIDLEAPIARYLPDLPEAWAGITVHHLLTHTSGLPDWESRGLLDLRRDYAPAEFIKVIAAHPLDFPPGTRWSYSNSAYPLLGMIIEHVTGEPFEGIVTQRVLVPAGMTKTRFRHRGEVVPDRVAGYADSAGVVRNGEPIVPRLLAPNGGILSTVGDMAKWYLALEGGRIVPAATFERMATPVKLNHGATFTAGIAWFIDTFRGHRFVFHNGSTAAGYSSVIYRFPEDSLFVVVLMNIDRGPLVNQLAIAVADLVHPGLSLHTLPERPDPDTVMSRRLLRLLADVASERDNELLADNVRRPGGAPRLPASFGFAGPVDRFAFLDREDRGPAGAERFGVVERWIYRYKLVAGRRVIWYTFELTPDGKVARFRPEEE
jgi:CubicO group peptidase (beta-lactamase class C family)